MIEEFSMVRYRVVFILANENRVAVEGPNLSEVLEKVQEWLTKQKLVISALKAERVH